MASDSRREEFKAALESLERKKKAWAILDQADRGLGNSTRPSVFDAAPGGT